MSEMQITVGKERNRVPVSSAKQNDLEWYAKNTKRDDVRAAVAAELARRANGGQPRAQQLAPVEAPVAIAITPLGKAMHDAAAVSKHLHDMAAQYHVVAPVTTVDQLPPGCGVSISLVQVNPNPNAKEVYEITGARLGLSSAALKRIAAAAAIDWDTEKSCRLDDGSDPHYVHYRAVGYVKNFDGSRRAISGEVEIDARDNSPQLDEIRQKAQYRQPPGDGAPQILELRKFILRHAETKAKSRAVVDMGGILRSYTLEELRKPFAVARLSFTGETDDPVLRRVFAEKTADAFLNGTAALYGKPSATRALGHAPPPVGDSRESADAGGYDLDAEGEECSPGWDDTRTQEARNSGSPF